MVLELEVQRDGQSLKELVGLARRAGTRGIRTLSEALGDTSTQDSSPAERKEAC